MRAFLYISFLTIFATYQSAYGQVDETLSAIQRALSEGNVQEAQHIFDEETRLFLREGDYLNLSYFIPYAGRIVDSREGPGKGIKAAESWLETILSKSKDPRDRRQAYLEVHTYYLAAGLNTLAYDANQKALEYTYQIPDHRPAEWAIIESNLGVIANLMGDFSVGKAHAFRALNGYNKDENPSEENIFNLLNNLGATYWYEAKWDSAEYYFTEGLKHVETMEPTLTNQYYRKSMLEGNLAAIFDIKGNAQESIRRVKSSIALIQYFIDHASDDPRHSKALLSLYYSSANLAAVYKSIGNYQEALEINEYILRGKEKMYPPNHPEIIESYILTGQAHNSLNNFEEAIFYLQKGLDGLQQIEGNYLIKKADTYYTLALVHESLKNRDEAKRFYELAEEHFELAHQGNYDYVYLGFLANASDFFSLNNDSKKALRLAKQGLDYILSVNGVSSIAGFNQLLNMGNIHYNLKDFARAKDYANQAKAIIEERIAFAEGDLDSVRIQFEKPAAILLQVKSDYQLAADRTVVFLQQANAQLDTAMRMLEDRKRMLSNVEDLNVLVSQSEELVDLIKKIQIELYELTGDESYLSSIISLQESSVYTKIRKQLNSQLHVRFANVPEDIVEEEQELKENLGKLWEGEGDLSQYLQNNQAWSDFLVKLKKSYPEYYLTRYASAEEGRSDIPSNLQVIRYFFVDGALFALVFHNRNQHLYKLDFTPDLITSIQENWEDIDRLSHACHKLYTEIWEPFADLLSEERVMIIPDGILHNLSFELLLSQPVKDFRAFATHSLLSKHAVSYHFSLWLLNGGRSDEMNGNYVAFVPGFFDEMKENYLSSVKDSLSFDEAYFSLLPQPFTLNLAHQAAKLLNGKSYTHAASTPEVFKRNAAKNRIIHIGTHAESNNITPAFSRLIFAKSEGGIGDENNSVYAYEIYNTNMQANLTILTACETGKPIYQPGEGMISLAHAFQYSGSESLLTSLWKIDEKSSMEITEGFLRLLSEGLPKDEALREAKLNYIINAKGRTISPQYWAGLVLIGDPAEIPLEKDHRGILWLAAIVAFIIIGILLINKRKIISLLRHPLR